MPATLLHLAIRTADADAGLANLSTCTAEVKRWYLPNGLQLNASKSEVILSGTSYQLNKASIVTVPVAGSSLPISEEMKTLGVTIDSHLTFRKHVSAVIKSCNYHAQAIRHIRHLLSQDIAHTLARSLILSKLDYCNSVLYGAQLETLAKLQRVQNFAACIVTNSGRRSDPVPLLQTLHWLPIRHRITYKLALVTYKVRLSSIPHYLNNLLSVRTVSRALRSSSAPLLHVPFSCTVFASRAFRVAAPTVWNSLPLTVQTAPSVNVFKSRLKTFLFNLAFNL